MQKLLKDIFENFSGEHNLNIQLSFDMPKGYEGAFGTFDILKNTLFINKSLINTNNKVRMIFTLYHELWHAKQYCFPEKFDNCIKNSLPYVILFDGTCYKKLNNSWQRAKLEDNSINFLEAYKSLSYEMNANNNAYRLTKRHIMNEELEELEEIYTSSLPTTKTPCKILKSIFNKIDNALISKQN